MTRFWRLPFDKSYIVLAIGVFLTYFVPIRMRVGPVMIVPFVVLWFILNLCRGERPMPGFMRRFFAFFVPLALFFLVRAFLFGYEEYDRVPFRRHILYSGIVLVYLYIFHYSVSRGKIRELRMLNIVILAVLAFGAFQSSSFEIGEYRNMGVVAGTSHETYANTIERLETASSGVSNYGDIYAMVFIGVALLAICRYVAAHWKFIYVLITLLFAYGIYRGAYTTALLVGLVMGLIVMSMQALKIKRRWFKTLLFAFAVFFVFLVAFPHLLLPLAPLCRGLAVIMEPLSQEYSMRLISLSDAFAGYKDTYAVFRAELYWNSVDIFLRRPLYGYRPNQIFFSFDYNMRMLGHSYFFDSLAAGGIILGGLLISGLHKYTQYIKFVYERYGLSSKLLDGWYAALATIAIISCINQINIFNLIIGFVFVVPSVPFLNYEYHVRNNQIDMNLRM